MFGAASNHGRGTHMPDLPVQADPSRTKKAGTGGSLHPAARTKQLTPKQPSRKKGPQLGGPRTFGVSRPCWWNFFPCAGSEFNQLRW